MISILSKTPSQIISDSTSSPSSPCKVGSPSIDFLDLIVKPNLSTASTLSTTDNFSVRADDEISKSPLTIESFEIKMPSKRAPKKNTPTEPPSLQEIATKRPYIKSNKYSKKNKEQPAATESCNKKRYILFDLNESLEVLTKKEKLNDNKERVLITSQNTETANDTPLLVLKDGKAEINTALLPQSEEKTINKTLEVVSNKKAKVTTSSSFKTSTHTKKWTEKETKKFYRALELFGTDFSMIAKLFPQRNRNQMKHKFLREEKQCPERINAVFKNIKTISFSGLMNRYQRKALKVAAINTPVRKSSSTNINIEGKAIEGPIFEHSIVRQERSGSFNSVMSLASVDMEIMDDLADAFVPSKINIF
jgi:hypothetical protein